MSPETWDVCSIMKGKAAYYSQRIDQSPKLRHTELAQESSLVFMTATGRICTVGERRVRGTLAPVTLSRTFMHYSPRL